MEVWNEKWRKGQVQCVGQGRFEWTTPPHRCLIFRRNPVLPRLRQRSQFCFSRLQIGCHGIGRRPQNLKHSSWDKQQMYKWQKHSIWIGQCCKQKKICKKSNMNQGKICQAVCVWPHPRLSASFWAVLRSVHLWCIFDAKNFKHGQSKRAKIFLSTFLWRLAKDVGELAVDFSRLELAQPWGAEVSVTQLTSVNEMSRWDIFTFLNLLRLFSDVSGRQPPLIAAEINGSPVSRQSCTFNNAARNSSPFSLQLIYLCRFAGDPRLPSVFFLFVKLES